MQILIIDTSKKEGVVAISKNGALTTQKTCPAKEFLPLAARHAKIPLHAIAIGIGPGSYTGTRAGVTFAKTLAFALKIPLLGFYSPLAYLPQEAGPFQVIVPAKGGQTCIIQGHKTTTTLQEHTHPQLETLPNPLPEHPLNLLPLLPYLQKRLESKDYDPAGEVEVTYLYSIPPPKATSAL